MKIALCIPVADKPTTPFLASALAMQAHTYEQTPGVRVRVHVRHDCHRIERARELLAMEALAGDADWLLWLDDDHEFPPDALLRLLAHGLPFIGVNCRKRIPERLETSARRIVVRLSGTKVVNVAPQHEGVEPVDILGFGITLTKAEMFAKLRKPWFRYTELGEDGYFCEQAIKAGYQPHVDHALSCEVGHIAETVLRFPA